MKKSVVQFNTRMLMSYVGLVVYLYAMTWIGLSYTKKMISYEIEVSQQQAAYTDKVIKIAQKNPLLISTAELEIMLENINQHKMNLVINASALTPSMTLDLEQELKSKTKTFISTVNHLLDPYVMFYQSILYLLMVVIIILLIKLCMNYPISVRAQKFGQKVTENPHLLTLYLVTVKVLISTTLMH
ncbi:hypothetical protein AB6D11_00380 [Vibrio splendidus]